MLNQQCFEILYLIIFLYKSGQNFKKWHSYLHLSAKVIEYQVINSVTF